MKIKRGQILKELRKSKGLNQSYFAEMLGISLTAYQKYEHGTAEPNFDNLSKLADFYGVTTDYLLGREPLPDPFADLNISREDEEELIETYMSFPPEVRAILIDSIRKLAGVSQNEPDKSRAIESNTRKVTITAGEPEDQWKAEKNAKNKDVG